MTAVSAVAFVRGDGAELRVHLGPGWIAAELRLLLITLKRSARPVCIDSIAPDSAPLGVAKVAVEYLKRDGRLVGCGRG